VSSMFSLRNDFALHCVFHVFFPTFFQLVFPAQCARQCPGSFHFFVLTVS
jgi:hypothetical protein